MGFLGDFFVSPPVVFGALLCASPGELIAESIGVLLQFIELSCLNLISMFQGHGLLLSPGFRWAD